MALEPRVTAFKLKKDIWWIPAGTIFDFEEGSWHVKEPHDQRLINETTLYAAVEQIVGFSEEDEHDLTTIEILHEYKPEPPEIITDYKGNKYRLIKDKD